MSARWLVGALGGALLACASLACESGDGAGDDAASDGVSDGAGDDAAAAQARSEAGDAGDGHDVGDAGDTFDAGAAPIAMPGDPNVLVGTFTLELVEEDAATGAAPLTSLVGFVRDAPVASSMLWDFAQAAGECLLEVPRFPFCDPECGPGRDCVDEDVCRDEPNPVDVGEVTVSGVRTNMDDADFVLTRIGASYQPERALDLEYPPADEGAPVRIAARGGQVAPFEITSHGIAPLQVDAGDSVPVARETALSLGWQPPDTDPDSVIDVVMDVSHHGGSRGRIVCHGVSDSAGALQIDAALITALLDLGTAGFPTVKLTRRSTGSAVTEHGRVELSVQQSIELPLAIPGLVSCADSAECPDGQSCLPTRKCG